MSKAVVYILIATAMLFFFIFLSPLNLKEPEGRLNRRFGYKLLERAPNFDPLVANIEKKTHHEPTLSNLDSTTSVSDVVETYQYLTSGGKLNTTLRLIILFPLLDREPKDGVVGFNELEAWITQRAIERLDYLTQAELDSKDKNGDLVISFKEYLPQFSEKDIEKKEMGHGEAGWWMERFEVADIDQNGFLNFTELRDFLHPEDSKNQEMLKWMLKDRLKRMDDENDGKLNFNEFEDHVFSTYESYMDFESKGGDLPSPKDKYAELDVNNDQFLSPEELIPILSYLYPGELAYAKYFTCYLMNEADDNGDGKLTLQEMLDHEFTFYNTVHADGHQESDDDHDEL
ncbi:calumenin-A [Cajanus cajan]|uniref:45 kDa calcium-binding protein n=1 Tax=Cajanus cajan TaxID=3821 RepID=A0A151TYK7_CAJCA|nr:calumenin-A [Cajanus cajan]KYP72098.1 45 kDa calcium-binding protein [Cajanus cajan]